MRRNLNELREIFGCRRRSALILAGLGVLSGGPLAPAAFAATTCTATSAPRTAVTAYARLAAGKQATPPLTDKTNGFAWPDTPIYAAETSLGLTFFASDGACHSNCGTSSAGPHGDATRTIGTLANPLGTSAPHDVAIQANANASVNPNFKTYTYIGGGPVYAVPSGKTGAGKLLMVYHAEINTQSSFYSLLGLAVSSDLGAHWTDIGEIVRPNMRYSKTLKGFDIGDPRLVISPDGQYFYLHFSDWPASGSKTYTVTAMARAPIATVLADAFGSTPHAASFEKYSNGAWTQPGVGGASTDLMPTSPYGGEHTVYTDTALGGYVMFMDDNSHITYSFSTDGVNWAKGALLGTYGTQTTRAEYSAALGSGTDPNNLGTSFQLYYTNLSQWSDAEVEAVDVSCQS